MNRNSISYNRSKVKWEYHRHGSTFDFPAGEDGKLAAQLFKLKVEFPPVSEAIDKLQLKIPNVDVTNRAIRGAIILADDQILAPSFIDDDNVCARIANEKKTMEYVITHGDSKTAIYKCTCMDYQKGVDRYTMSPGDPNRPSTGAPKIEHAGIMCKHTWGFHFLKTFRYMSEDTNPFSDFLSEKLYHYMKGQFEQNGPISHFWNNSTPILFSRGQYIIETKEELSKEHLEWVQTAILNATSKSMNLIIK